MQSHSPLPQRDRLPFTTKASYGLGTSIDMWSFWLYPSVAFAVFNMYLGVDPFYVGLALTLIRLIDAFSDPFCGWVSDNVRSKWGRRRPFILFAGIGAGVGLPLLFLVSPDWVGLSFMGAPVIFWYMLASSLIYIPVASLFSMPWNSLGSELTPDYDERTSLMTYKSAMQKVFEVGNFFALKFTNLSFFLFPAVFSTADGEKKNTLLGMQVYTCLLGLIMVVFALVMFVKLKERYYETVAVKQKRIPIIKSLTQTLGCKPYRTMLYYALAFQLGTSMVGTLGYYATVWYVCKGDNVLGDEWNFLNGLGYMILGFFGPPVFSIIAHKLTKKKAAIIACNVGILAYGGTWFLYNPMHPWMQVIASGSMAFAGASIWMIHGSIGADIVDYDELHTGERREGAFASFGSWILKLGNSLGNGIIPGLILKYSQFDASLPQQTPDTILWIRSSLAIFPILGLTTAIIFMLTFPLTKERVLEIRKELEARRGTV